MEISAEFYGWPISEVIGLRVNGAMVSKMTGQPFTTGNIQPYLLGVHNRGGCGIIVNGSSPLLPCIIFIAGRKQSEQWAKDINALAIRVLNKVDTYVTADRVIEPPYGEPYLRVDYHGKKPVSHLGKPGFWCYYYSGTGSLSDEVQVFVEAKDWAEFLEVGRSHAFSKEVVIEAGSTIAVKLIEGV